MRDAPAMPIANCSPLESTGPRCEIGEAATVTSGVAEAEVAAKVVRRAILYERERREPVDADHADVGLGRRTRL